MNDLSDQELIEIIDDDGEGLNTWEANFISDMLDIVGRGDTLSDGRRSKAEQIYRDRVE